jgi:hypothetical protein
LDAEWIAGSAFMALDLLLGRKESFYTPERDPGVNLLVPQEVSNAEQKRAEE